MDLKNILATRYERQNEVDEFEKFAYHVIRPIELLELLEHYGLKASPIQILTHYIDFPLFSLLNGDEIIYAVFKSEKSMSISGRSTCIIGYFLAEQDAFEVARIAKKKPQNISKEIIIRKQRIFDVMDASIPFPKNSSDYKNYKRYGILPKRKNRRTL